MYRVSGYRPVEALTALPSNHGPPSRAATASALRPGPPSSNPPKPIAAGSLAMDRAVSAIEPSFAAAFQGWFFSTMICIDMALGAARGGR